MQTLTYAYIAATNLVRERAAAMRKNESGQGAAEYLGMAVVVLAIIGVLATTDLGNKIKENLTQVIDDIMNAGG